MTNFQQVTKYILKYPRVRELLKKILSSDLILNSTPYKFHVFRTANTINLKYQHLPKKLSIENTLSCNSKCIMCAHFDTHMQGVMHMDLYEDIIDQCYHLGINRIEFGGYGEPLLDEYFFERIRYLRKYNMEYSFGTNASLLNEDKAKKIFQLGGLKKIIISANAYDPRIYEYIMVGLSHNKTYRNVFDFLKLKEKYNKKEIIVRIKTVKLNINKHDIKHFVRFWKQQKGVDQIVIADLWDRVGNRDVRSVGTLNSFHSKNGALPCRQLWDTISIYYDGQVAPCYYDHDLRNIIIGNMNKQRLSDMFYGEAIANLRKIHLDGKRATHPICGDCPYNGIWL